MAERPARRSPTPDVSSDCSKRLGVAAPKRKGWLSDAILESRAAIVSARAAKLPLCQLALTRVYDGNGIPESCENDAVTDFRMICSQCVYGL